MNVHPVKEQDEEKELKGQAEEEVDNLEEEEMEEHVYMYMYVPQIWTASDSEKVGYMTSLLHVGIQLQVLDPQAPMSVKTIQTFDHKTHYHVSTTYVLLTTAIITRQHFTDTIIQ